MISSYPGELQWTTPLSYSKALKRLLPSFNVSTGHSASILTFQQVINKIDGLNCASAEHMGICYKHQPKPFRSGRGLCGIPPACQLTRVPLFACLDLPSAGKMRLGHIANDQGLLSRKVPSKDGLAAHWDTSRRFAARPLDLGSSSGLQISQRGHS